MKQIFKRSLAVLVAFLLCISLMPTSQIVANAATVEYVYSGNYIYNWGTRGETATFLSPNAEAFYADNNTSYDELSALAGGTGTSDAPNSALYSALQELMVDNHITKTSYDATRSLYQYTDCQNSAKDTTAISCFYSGAAIGPEWDSGKTWNREHTWPDSKGLNGQDENDIMMLRPTKSNVNSSRGNKAYGEVTGTTTYNPNDASSGAYDLRGDVSRIFLYMYVRWGNTEGNGEYTAWGTSGVIESLDVLIKWMAADPVDTWELGRNDAVEAITGTRNVFVDYPEFAFQLFGADMPEDMATPSGEAADEGCVHEYVAGTPVAATCTSEGYTPYTCKLCKKTYNDDVVAKLDHNYVDGVCGVCGTSEDKIVAIYAPAYNMALSAEKVATYYNKGVDISGGFGTLTDAEKWVMTENDDGSYSFTSLTGKVLAMAASNNSLNDTGANDDWTITAIEGSDNLYYIKNTVRGTYLEWYASRNNWSTYSNNSDDQFELSFYEFVDCDHEYSEEVVEPTCTEDGYTKYTCTLCGTSYNGNVIEAGGHDYTEEGYCSVCEELKPEEPVYTVHFLTPDGVAPVDPIICGEETINFPAAPEAPEGYTFVGWSKTATADTTTPPTYYSAVTGTFPIDADNCRVFYALYKYDVETEGEEGGSTGSTSESGTVSLSFADAGNRTFQDSAQQIWEQNGIKLTNKKGSSTSNVAAYANPARFYASSQIIVECTGMTQIEFNCNSTTYASNLNKSIGTIANGTVAVSSKVVTVTFTEEVDSFEIAKLSAQVRMDSMNVTAASTGSGSTGPVVTTYYTTIIGDSCPHKTYSFYNGVDATCTEGGKLADLVCSDECGEILWEGTATEAKGHIEKVLEGYDASCKSTGLTEGKHCLRCDVTTVPQEEISMTEHTYDNDSDLDCNDCGHIREPLIVKGDADGNGTVDKADYESITMILLKAADYIEILDMNDDGKIDVIDGVLLRKIIG